MRTEEMSDLFDVMSSANQRQAGFGNTDFLTFDEYEKSVYLTLAQQAFVTACYNGRNESGYQFEVTEEDRRILDSLVMSIEAIEAQGMNDSDHIVEGSKFYLLPPNLMFITYEQVKFSDTEKQNCASGKTAVVVPVTQDEFWKTYNNPFRGPDSNRVLRLDARNNVVELVSKYDIGKYFIRFIRKPNPIVLVDMPSDSDLSVFNGNTVEMPCELDDNVHARIVEIAVNMALQRKNIANSR